MSGPGSDAATGTVARRTKDRETQDKSTSRAQRGTEDRGTGRRDVVIDTGLGPMTVAGVVRDTPPVPFHEQMLPWVPDAVRSEIRTLEEAGVFHRDKLAKAPKSRFLKRYPNTHGAVVVWVGVAHNVELHTYREFPEVYEFYLQYAEGDEESARLLHETYTQFNRDLWHFINDLGMRPDFARGELRHINDQVFKLVLEMAAMLLTQGATLGAIRASGKKVLETKRRAREGGVAPKAKKSPAESGKPPSRMRISVEEEAILKKELGDKDYSEHLDALETLRRVSPELHDLSDVEIVAIRAYSHNTADKINRAMRHGGITPEIRVLIDWIVSGLKKLPAVKETVERGIAIGPKDAQALFVEGKVYIDEAFQSATQGTVPFTSTVQMTIRAVGKNARDISKIAAHDEKEVMFLPGTRLRVDKVARDQSGDVRLVDLTEL